MRKFFIKILIVAVIVFTGLYLLTKHLENRFINNNNNKTTWIINRSGDTVDYAFLGSSKVHNQIDIKTLIDSTNLQAINLGISGSGYLDSYLVLKKYIEKNKIKNLILEIDYFIIRDPKIIFAYPFHDYLFVPFMDSDLEIDKILKENSTAFDYYKWKFLPASRYIEYNNIYIKPEYFTAYKYNPKFDEYGTELLDSNVIMNFKFVPGGEIIADSSTMSAIKKIIDLCTKNGINMIFLTTPHYFKVYDEYNIEKVKDVIPNLANENNIRYINFKGHPLENFKHHYADDYHLAEKGAKIFSRILRDSLLIN